MQICNHRTKKWNRVCTPLAGAHRSILMFRGPALCFFKGHSNRIHFHILFSGRDDHDKGNRYRGDVSDADRRCSQRLNAGPIPMDGRDYRQAGKGNPWTSCISVHPAGITNTGAGLSILITWVRRTCSLTTAGIFQRSKSTTLSIDCLSKKPLRIGGGPHRMNFASASRPAATSRT